MVHGVYSADRSETSNRQRRVTLASCLIYARAFVEYVGAFCYKMLPSVKFAEDKVLTFLILRENAKIVQP